MKKFAVLYAGTTNENIEIHQNYVAELQKLMPETEVIEITYRQLEYTIIDNQPIITHKPSGIDLAELDAVHFKNWVAYSEASMAVAEYLKFKDVKFVCSEVASLRALTKLPEMYAMASLGLNVPNTWYVTYENQVEFYSELLEQKERLVIKAIGGKGGDENYLVSKGDDLSKILNTEYDYIAQEFIENDFDYRVFVIGDDVPLIIKRSRDKNSGSHMNNTSQGAEGEVVDLSVLTDDLKAQSVQIAKKLGREIAGVDILVSHSDESYFLEVNKGPQIATGAEIDKKYEMIVKYYNSLLS